MKKFKGCLTISVTYKYDFEVESENIDIARIKLNVDPLKYTTKETNAVISKPKSIRFDKEHAELSHSFAITCPHCGSEAVESHYSDNSITTICFGRCV